MLLEVLKSVQKSTFLDQKNDRVFTLHQIELLSSNECIVQAFKSDENKPGIGLLQSRVSCSEVAQISHGLHELRRGFRKRICQRPDALPTHLVYIMLHVQDQTFDYSDR